MVKISFIVPIYNREKYLPICLNSIFNQTETSIEVICINDNSTDHSEEILKRYEKIYKDKLKIITLEENKGPSYARNIGLDTAQGKYIIYVDSDDIIALNMGEDFTNVAQEYQVPIVIGGHHRISEKSYLYYCPFKAQNNKDLNWVSFSNENGQNIFYQNVSAWAKAYDHDLLENEYFKDGCVYEDVGLVYRLFLKGKQAVKINDSYYGYRQNSTGIMSQSRIISTDIMDILDVCLDAKKYANSYQLSEFEMTCLDDIFKRELLRKISWIKSWNIKEQDQRFLIEKLLTVYNYYFPDITTLETEKGKKNTKYILSKLKDYEYENIETPKAAHLAEKRALRKIRSLKANPPVVNNK